MMVPQPTAQYGQVERVSLARAIFRVRNCAYAGFKSKPNTAAAAPPIVVNFRKSRREGFMLAPPSAKGKEGRVSQKFLHTTCWPLCQALILPARRCCPRAKYLVTRVPAGASIKNAKRALKRKQP